MPNKRILLQLVKKLKQYLGIYKMLKNKHSFAEYESNPEIYMAIDRILQLSIECCIDIGKEIIAGRNLEKPAHYRDTFVILSKRKIISHDISEKMQELAGFRNELVHDYLYLDPKKVFTVFQNTFDTFKTYLKEVEDFTAKN